MSKMDTNGIEKTTPAHLHDHEAEIDRMLMDLVDIQEELVQPEEQPPEEEIPENNEPLDQISFSMNAIEESGDVDLDALLEDLCNMEKDLYVQADMKSNEEARARSPSPSKKRLSSPIKVTADVKMQLESLGEELENQKELTIEEQQAKFKEEKIRIAMEKLREARIKKLVIKVFNDEDPTSKTILVDQSWTAWDVCKKMIIKYDREASTNWVLEERQPGNQLHRVLEDHECIVDIVSQWPRETDNQIVFTIRRDKYVLFKNPQNYLLSSDTHEGSARLAEQSKDTLISEFFKPDAMRLPNLDGVLHLKEGRKKWNAHYFLLRASGIYYTAKGKAKNQRNMSCLVSFENTYVYTTTDFKRNHKAPTDHCFVLKPSISKDLESRQVKCLCASDASTMQRWITCIRVGKFGFKMLENKNVVHQEVEELTVGAIKRPRTLSSGSSSSSELGSLESGSIRGRSRSDVGDHSHRKGSSLKREQPIQGSRTLAKLFQEAWKKGAEAEQAMSPTSPRTPFSPSRTAQTPHSGPKSFFVENEKLRNLDNIKEEGDVKQAKKGASLVLDPAPLPRKSFSNQTTNSVPPPPPPSLPKVLRTEQVDTNKDENWSPIPQEEPSRNGIDAPQSPLRGLSPPPPPPPPLQGSDSPSFDEDLPLPPPPMLPSPNEDISPSNHKKGKPEIYFPPPPPISTNNSGPPPPPPPPPLAANSTNF